MTTNKKQPGPAPDKAPKPWIGAPAGALADGGRLALVSLAELVRWLMQSRGLEFEAASQDLHDALAGLKGLRLYVRPPNSLMRPVGPSDTFGLTVRAGRRVFSAGIGLPPPPAPAPPSMLPGVTPGVPAALYFVRDCWGGGKCTADAPAFLASTLAMPADQAAAIWGAEAQGGAARPLTWAECVAERRELRKGSSWTDAQHAALLAAIRAGKTPGEMAADLGISRQTVEESVERARSKQIDATRAGEGGLTLPRKVHRVR